jgi:hypothetical protein
VGFGKFGARQNLIATSARPISLTIYAPATATAMSLRFGERRQRCGYAQRKSWWIVRGNRGDYDHWERSGATGWSNADVLPYFKRNETFAEAADPLWDDWLDAAKAAGYTINADFNGRAQLGFWRRWRGPRGRMTGPKNGRIAPDEAGCAEHEHRSHAEAPSPDESTARRSSATGHRSCRTRPDNGP